MSPERYQQIGELYQQVLQLEASERGAFLAKACDSDEDLRKEVESLVSSTQEIKSFLIAAWQLQCYIFANAELRSLSESLR